MKLGPGWLATVVAVLGAAEVGGGAQAPRAGAHGASASDSAGAHAAALRFVAAFDSLQLEPFRAALAPDVTVFMPGGGSPGARLDGPAPVEAVFGRMFGAARADQAHAGRDGPAGPNIGARMRDLRVQVAGRAAAVVTFQVGPDSHLARHSLVLRLADDGVWRVAHWHASNARAHGGEHTHGGR